MPTMSIGLRLQWLLIGFISLALPWSGCQYVADIEHAWQQEQASLTLEQIKVYASQFNSHPALLERDATLSMFSEDQYSRFFTPLIKDNLEIDGYNSDWPSFFIKPYIHRSNQIETTFYAAVSTTALYIYARIEDPQPTYHNPSGVRVANGDHIKMRTQIGEHIDYLFFSTEAPGEMGVYRSPDPDGYHSLSLRVNSADAVWQDLGNAHSIEARIPLDQLQPSSLSLDALPKDDTFAWLLDIGILKRTASSSPTQEESRLDEPLDYFTLSKNQQTLDDGRQSLWIKPSQKLQENFYYRPYNSRITQIVDREGWPLASLADEGHPDRDALTPQESLWQAFINRLYRIYFWPGANVNRTTLEPYFKYEAPQHTGAAYTIWQYTEEQRLMQSGAKIHDAQQKTIGRLILEQNSASLSDLSDKALARLFNRTFVLSLIVMCVLLAYATWLSFRIRRLRNATEHAVNESGQLQNANTNKTLPSAKSRDELGDLSRTFSSLLERISNYNAYLKSLSDKLAHELRTPMTIVKSSVELLQQQELNKKSQEYAQRALTGSQRLQKLLKDMSEATRLEQSIAQHEHEHFDLRSLIKDIGPAYSDTYQRPIEIDVPDSKCHTQGTPELIVQMLDKLIDNATQFSKDDQRIAIALSTSNTDDKTGRRYQIDIINQGSQLPEAHIDHLFESLVSHRKTSSETPHLGLGLYIVKLIVGHHQGEVSAHNTIDGVCFRIILPATPCAPPF